MAEKKKPKKQRTPGETRQTTYRLGADTLAHLDAIAAHLSGQMPVGTASRTDAIRFAAKEMAEKISQKPL